MALNRLQLGQFFPEGVANVGDLNVIVLSTDKLTDPEWRDALNLYQPRVLITGWSTPRLDPTFIKALGGSVEYISHVVGSIRGIATKEMLLQGLQVSNWGALAAPIVAEHAILLVLAALRNLPAWSDFMRQDFVHDDKARLETRSLRGKHVGVLGFGGVARALITLLKPFGVTISAYSAGVPSSIISTQGVAPADSLQSLLRGVDVLVCCEALNDETRKSVGMAELECLPIGAVFVNVGRGAVVDETALFTVAKSRKLRLACDVFTHEPLASDSPLWTLPDAIFSPHIAGPTVDFYATCGAQALENVRRYLNGQEPSALITTAHYDRAS